jgi:ribonuclease D
MGVDVQGPIECTKTLMKMLYPGQSNSLGPTLRETLGVSLNKKIDFNWDGKLSARQKEYIVGDVLYLHKLVTELKRKATHGELLRYPLAIQTIRSKAILEVEGYGDTLDYSSEEKEISLQLRSDWAKVMFMSQNFRANCVQQ